MNRKIYPLIPIFLLVFALALLSGCVSSQSGSSSESGPDPVVGTWEVVSLTVGSSELEADEYLSSIGMEKSPVIVFKENGTVRFTGLGEGVDPNGEWEKEEQAYTLNDGEEELNCRINDDGQLELIYPEERSDALSGDLIITFERQEEKE